MHSADRRSGQDGGVQFEGGYAGPCWRALKLFGSSRTDFTSTKSIRCVKYSLVLHTFFDGWSGILYIVTTGCDDWQQWTRKFLSVQICYVQIYILMFFWLLFQWCQYIMIWSGLDFGWTIKRPQITNAFQYIFTMGNN